MKITTTQPKLTTSIVIRVEVASSGHDFLPTLSAAKTSKISLLVNHHIVAIDEVGYQQEQLQQALSFVVNRNLSGIPTYT